MEEKFFSFLAFWLKVNPAELYKPYRLNQALPKSQLPDPIFEDNPEYVRLYWKAWELAWAHVLERNDTPQPLYIDEAMDPGQIWIWDTCFMALFCRYGHKAFPGIESLDNFYAILYDNAKSAVKIHFADNPPLFAWIESEYVKFTGDLDRVRKVVENRKYLQKHYDFIENGKKWKKLPNVLVLTKAVKETLGYKWQGNTSGMDNTPRGRNWWNNTRLNPRGQIVRNNIYWLDLLAQQALAAKCITKLAKLIDLGEVSRRYAKEHQKKCELLNAYYWDPEDKFFYDLKRKYHKYQGGAKFNKVKTIASFWPLLANCVSQSQADHMAKRASNPKVFGGKIPWPSLSRDDAEFKKKGRYWRGGVWLPTAYMATKGLEQYGHEDLADEMSERLLKHMIETERNFEPHTIWEAYSPSEAKPSTQKKNKKWVREDFCGWSALGPISMFIENIIGIRKVNAIKRAIEWQIHQEGKHGLKNLQFGDITVDLVYEKGEIYVKSNGDFTLLLQNILGGKSKTSAEIHSGEQQIPL